MVQGVVHRQELTARGCTHQRHINNGGGDKMEEKEKGGRKKKEDDRTDTRSLGSSQGQRKYVS